MTPSILPITGLPIGAVSENVLVCGDPARATRIGRRLSDVSPIADRREYRSLRGTFRGAPLTVCSHGIGAPGAAAAFEELIAAGARRIIRVGTCGGMQPGLGAGALVVARAAVQWTGYGREIVPEGYPAVADLELTAALESAADGVEDVHSGIVLTRDAFYQGIGTPHTPDYEKLSAANVLAVEMECAALFLVGALRGVATGAILAVDGNVLETPESMDDYQPGRDVVAGGVERAIDLALVAMTPEAGS